MSELDDFRSVRDTVKNEAPGVGRAVFKIGVVVILVSVGLGVVGTCAGWFGEAASVAREQLGPRELLKKYETFKNMHAQLAAKKANIDIYNVDKQTPEQLAALPRDMRQEYALRQQEAAGMKANFNDLAAQYNAAMSKINWSFCNVGQLPEGATEPLPREYVPYVVK